MKKIYLVICFSFISIMFVKAQAPYIMTGTSNGLGQYGYLEKDATTFLNLNSDSYGNIYQLFGRTYLNGQDILTYGSAINSCAGSNQFQSTPNLNFGANAIPGQIAYTSVHADYCGGSNSYSGNPNSIGSNQREHFIFDVTDRPSDLATSLIMGDGILSNVVMSLKIDFGTNPTRILERFFVQNSGTLTETISIGNDAFEMYYEPATGTEVLDGNEAHTTLYGNYGGDDILNNIWGNGGLNIPIPSNGLRLYVVLYKYGNCLSNKSVKLSTINDGLSFSPAMDGSYKLARINSMPTNPATISLPFSTAPTVTIAASPSGSICPNTPVTFTANPFNGGSSPFYQWKVNLAPVGTNSSTFTSTTLNNNDFVSVTMTSSLAPCFSGVTVGSNLIFIVVNGSTWLGVDNNWNNTANWCGGVPTSSTNVVIPSGAPNYPILSSATANAANISIQNGANITVNGTGVFNLYGNITAIGTGNMDVTAGTLNMAGASPQTLSGASILNGSIKNLLISNNVSIVTGTPVKITEEITFPAGGKTLTTNDNLVLVSDINHTANLGNLDVLNGSGTLNDVIGKVEIQRYLFAKKSWRLLATPVDMATSPSINDSWREGISSLTSNGFGTRISGPAATPGATVPTGGLDEYALRGSMKYFNGSNYTEITGTDLNSNIPIANKEGYYLFVRGDRGIDINGATIPTTLRIKGNIRKGLQNFVVASNSFQSIGNPFPSRINMQTVNFITIGQSFYIWNPNAVGSYNVGKFELYTHNGTGFANVPFTGYRNYIESGEAFFVQENTGNPGSLIIQESDKGNGSVNVSRTSVNRPTLEINLHTNNTSGIDYTADGLLINFDNNYSNNVDNQDVRKISSTYDNISIKQNNSLLIVDRRKPLTETDTIRLNLTGMRTTNYTLEIDPSVLSNTSLSAFLQDKFLQTETPISLVNVTNISFTVTADAASKGADRFMITFKAAPSLSFTNIAAARNNDKMVIIKWGVQNEVNVVNYSLEYSNNGVNFAIIKTQLATANNGTNTSNVIVDPSATKGYNWYRIKANTNNGAFYSSIAMVNPLQADVVAQPSISVYPNPVEGKLVHLMFVNKEGNYTLRIFSSEGKELYNQSLIIGMGLVNKQIALPKSIAAGQYQISLLSENGKTEMLPIIVQ